MKVVSFKDGTYGIRKFSWLHFAYRYKDMNGYNTFWWPMKSEYFNYDCKRKDPEFVKNYYHAITDKGSVYKS
jgi:hypothetical protein